jgi:hypothetical protein
MNFSGKFRLNNFQNYLSARIRYTHKEGKLGLDLSFQLVMHSLLINTLFSKVRNAVSSFASKNIFEKIAHITEKFFI